MSASDRGAHSDNPPTSDASAALGGGTMSVSPRRRATCRATDSVPRMARRHPSRPSSPTATTWATASGGSCPVATRRPRAIGRSNAVPPSACRPGEVHRHATRGSAKSGVWEPPRRAHGSPHRAGGQPDDRELRKTLGDVHLDGAVKASMPRTAGIARRRACLPRKRAAADRRHPSAARLNDAASRSPRPMQPARALPAGSRSSVSPASPAAPGAQLASSATLNSTVTTAAYSRIRRWQPHRSDRRTFASAKRPRARSPPLAPPRALHREGSASAPHSDAPQAPSSRRSPAASGRRSRRAPRRCPTRQHQRERSEGAEDQRREPAVRSTPTQLVMVETRTGMFGSIARTASRITPASCAGGAALGQHDRGADLEASGRCGSGLTSLRFHRHVEAGWCTSAMTPTIVSQSFRAVHAADGCDAKRSPSGQKACDGR